MTIIAFIIGLSVPSVLIFAVVSLIGNIVGSVMSVLFFAEATIPTDMIDRTLMDNRIARGEASKSDIGGKILQLFIISTLFRPPLMWVALYAVTTMIIYV